MLRTVDALGLFATVTGHQPDSTQAGSFRASLEGWRQMSKKAFHEMRRI